MRHPGKACSRTMIFDAVWDTETASSNIVDALFGRLRRRLKGAGVYILGTVHGVGYTFDP
ncbi:winged helix-turn-helix domain-containing protein (plasmid) [Deinococcus radiomollis]|uniref:winged helix-turn-helix domain-containing protein n=1 Tax=Deinococcus radiomollis TaxID=468916 RepID=UPI0038922973